MQQTHMDPHKQLMQVGRAHSKPLPSFCYLNYEISLQLLLLWKLLTVHGAYFSQGVEKSRVWFIE